MPKIFLVSGDDPNLLSQRVRELASECVGESEVDLVLSRFETTDYETEDGYDLSPMVSAAATPPMLESHRVVEARNLALFSTERDLTGLYDYLENPLETNDLILVWEKGQQQTRQPTLPKKLKDAVTQAGGSVISAGKPRGVRDVKGWFAEQVNASGLSLNQGAEDLLRDRLGEDLGRLQSVLMALKSTFGSDTGDALTADDIRPYLGAAGSVPVWELTAALSKGDKSNGVRSVACLRRQLSAGNHPLAILGFLVNHYTRLTRLDGAGFKNADQVSKALGLAPYPAKLALEESRKLGTRKLARIFELLQKADGDLKGGSGLDGEIVMEIMLARIAQQYRV